MKLTKAKSFPVFLLAVSLVCSMATVTAEAPADYGYDTVYSHVYSPMDLMDGSTTLGNNATPALNNGLYDSSVWKFGISNKGDFYDTTDNFEGPDVQSGADGVKLSWNAVEGNNLYTVLIYKTDGSYSNSLMTKNTQITLSDISFGIYKFQIISDTGAASEVTTFKNIMSGITMSAANSTTPAVISEDNTAATVSQGNKTGDFIINLNNKAKSAINAGGAILLKYETVVGTGEDITLSNATAGDSTVNSSDCWVGFHSFLYPTSNNGDILETAQANFYSNSGDRQVGFYDLSGNSVYNINMGFRGVHCDYYEKAVNFKNGYILIPLDDFDVDVSSGNYTYNLIETAKTNGLLYMANTAKEYYYNENGTTYTKTLTSEENLFDRSVTFSDGYIISDYDAYISGGLISKSAVSNYISAAGDFTVTKNTTFPDNYIPFTANGIQSSYNFYCTTTGFTKSAATYKQRSITFGAAAGEEMMFGFTAPVSGTYEISAPISATGTNVRYSVLKTNSSGGRDCLMPEKAYSTAGNFCDIMVTMEAGDTVWLKASGDNGAVIDIGIPKAHLFNASGAVAGENNSVTYNYRAMDYFEDTNSSGITYGTVSTTENAVGAWDYGYFKYTADFDTTLAAFKNASITLPNASNGVLDDSVLNAMKDYELIRYGNYYNANDLTDAIIQTKASGAGVMYASTAASNLTATSNIRLGFHDLTAASEGAAAYGHYLTFTAPTSGTAVLANQAVALANGAYMAIAVNNEVRNCTFASTNGDDVSIGNLNAGDKVTILFYSFKSTKNTLEIGNPVISLTHATEAPVISGDVDNSGEVNILDLIRAKKYHANLTDEINFKALDIDNNGIINVLDLAELRKMLLA